MKYNNYFFFKLSNKHDFDKLKEKTSIEIVRNIFWVIKTDSQTYQFVKNQIK